MTQLSFTPWLTLLALTTATLSTSAMAASELQLESTSPVVLKIDGQSMGTVQPLEPLLIDITPGVHELAIEGVLGKSHYQRDLIFDDDTRTELVWQRKELRLGQVVTLDPNRPEDERVADAPNEAPSPLDSLGDDRRAAAPVQPQRRAEPRRPEIPAPPVHASRAPAPPVRDVSPPAAPPGATGSMVIQATDGLDLQIAHGSQLLRISVVDGELVVTDARGTTIQFPSDNGAW